MAKKNVRDSMLMLFAAVERIKHVRVFDSIVKRSSGSTYHVVVSTPNIHTYLYA